MAPGVPSKVIAASCGLTAFVIAIIAGLSVSNPADTVLTRALICMVGANILGLVIGSIGERTMLEAAARTPSSSSPTPPAPAPAPARPGATA